MGAGRNAAAVLVREVPGRCALTSDDSSDMRSVAERILNARITRHETHGRDHFV
jgi:hypothetical protein